MGELAALATSLSWCFTSLLFAEAARRVGALRVNLLRLPVAIVLLSSLLVFRTAPLTGLDTTRVSYLAVSGVVGLAVGDLAFFATLRRLGARLALLLLSLAPIFSAVLAFVLLDERLGVTALAGMALTLGGVGWVVSERPAETTTTSEGAAAGVLLGLTAAFCQGTGLVLAKLGMEGQVLPLAAAWVRMIAATAVIWTAVLVTGRARTMAIGSAARRAGRFVLGGAFFGPFLGMWLSLVAAKLTAVGIAATIMATNPVLIIPMVMVLEGYRPSVRAVLGTVATVAGVVLLFRA